MFLGPGAGGTPTASAVMGDVVTAARNRVRGGAGPGASLHSGRDITPAGDVTSRYYVALSVDDVPGVLARVAACFASHEVSLQAVRQSPLDGEDSDQAHLGVMTHVAPDRAIRQTVSQLESMDEVREGIRVMRVEGM